VFKALNAVKKGGKEVSELLQHSQRVISCLEQLDIPLFLQSKQYYFPSLRSKYPKIATRRALTREI
jgi:hypothetical protein